MPKPLGIDAQTNLNVLFRSDAPWRETAAERAGHCPHGLHPICLVQSHTAGHPGCRRSRPCESGGHSSHGYDVVGVAPSGGHGCPPTAAEIGPARHGRLGAWASPTLHFIPMTRWISCTPATAISAAPMARGGAVRRRWRKLVAHCFGSTFWTHDQPGALENGTVTHLGRHLRRRLGQRG